jgi:hypothetical protein
MLEIEQRVQGGTAPAHQSGVHEGFSMGYLRDLLNEWHAHGVPDDAVVTTEFLHVHAYWTEQREEMAQPDGRESDCTCESDDNTHESGCGTAERWAMDKAAVPSRKGQCAECGMGIEWSSANSHWQHLHFPEVRHNATPEVGEADAPVRDIAKEFVDAFHLMLDALYPKASKDILSMTLHPNRIEMTSLRKHEGKTFVIGKDDGTPLEKGDVVGELATETRTIWINLQFGKRDES